MLVRVQLGGGERRMTREQLEAAVRAKEIGPETPIDLGDGWRPARAWVEWETLSQTPGARVRAAWDSPSMPWATALVVGLCIKMHLWTLALGLGGLVERLTRNTGAIVEGGEVWRLLSYATLHAGWDHIAMNMLFLAWVGVALERLLHGREVLVLFLASAVGGALLSMGWRPEVEAVGASGADFGFMGAAAALGLRWGEDIPPRARARFGFVMAAYAGWVLINGASAEKVDNMAHFGGLLVGALLGAAWAPLAEARNRRVSYFTLAGVAAVFVGVAVAGPRLQPWTPVEDDGTRSERPAWWTVGWAPTGEQGWRSPDGRAAMALVVGPGQADEAWIEAIRALDPAAELAREGARLTARYQQGGVARVAEARVEVHGRHRSFVLVDAPAGDRRGPWLRRALDRLEVERPTALGDALAAADSSAWRLRMKAAAAAADWGEADEARRIADSVLELAPEDPAAAAAWVDFAREQGWADTVSRAEAAAARFPGDRGVAAAWIRALAASGRGEEARQRLDAEMQAAPGDRTLQRLHAELQKTQTP